MIFLVLLPFVLGKILRISLKKQQVSSSWSYVTSSCVILVVYSALSLARHELYALGLGTYIQILCTVALVHGVLLLINAQGAKLLQLPPADGKALIFVASQKTFPVSLAVLAGLGGTPGNAVIVCLVFHFFQLFADSLLASFIRRR
jgi:sodium/bile acid cotransporter 7